MSLISCSANVRSHQLPTPTYQHTNIPTTPPSHPKPSPPDRRHRTDTSERSCARSPTTTGRPSCPPASADAPPVSFLALHWRWDISHLEDFRSRISCGYISSSVMCLQYIFSMCMWYVYIYIYIYMCVCVFWNMMIECVYPLMMLEVSRPKKLWTLPKNEGRFTSRWVFFASRSSCFLFEKGHD